MKYPQLRRARQTRAAILLQLALSLSASVGAAQESASGTEEPVTEPPEDVPEAEAPEVEAAAPEAPDAELDAMEGETTEHFARPPAKGKGVVWGVIRDGLEHETMPEAQVSVVGTRVRAFSDIDGRFRLELAPGRYSLRVYFELYRPTVVRDVTVVAGRVEQIDLELLPEEAAIETVEVTEEVEHGSLDGQMLSRQRATTVGDGVGRAEISKTPAGNAAQAAQRILGANIVGNRFVYVRGLGERYTNAQLNGAPLPSPEPDQAAIPLDLFPSLVVEGITIVKTFTPDSPADFAGGSVRIETRELPSKPLFQLSASGAYDTSTTFRHRLSHQGSPTDFLGFDSGTRWLPNGFPSYVLIPNAPKPGGGTIGREDFLEAGRSINSSMNPTRSFSPPNHGLSVVAGNGWSLGGEQRLGAIATFNYSRAFKRRGDVLARVFAPNTQIDPLTGAMQKTISLDKDLTIASGEDKVSWGALGSVSYWPSQRHRITLLGMHTQLSDASSQLTQGFYAGQMAEVASVRLRYVTRALNVLQLRGTHDLPALNAARLDWNAAYSIAARAEPDTRNTVYQFNADQGSWNAPNTPENGSHLFADQKERSFGGGLDYTQPITSQPEDAKLKLGGLASVRERSFAARRFNFGATPGGPTAAFRCPGQSYDQACPVPLYQYDNVGPVLSLSERTFPEDAYHADLSVLAGYLMADVALSSRVQLLGGARVERTDQSIDPYSQFATGDDPEGARIRSTDVLPAMSLAYAATKKTKLRVAVSRTLARPQLRELSPYVFTDYFGARPISGNPRLRLTYIKNFDLRFEAFPTQREVLAFSFFYKVFDDPIEPYISPSGDGVISYQNAKGARVVGLELEARKSLGFVALPLKDLSFIGNLTLAYSRIQLDDASLLSVTNESRAMVNQAPYVVNLALDYAAETLGLNARVLYNVVGPRIVEVGTNDLDDAYEQPRHSLDLSVSKQLAQRVQLKLNVNNLLDAPFVVTLGKENRADRAQLRFREGLLFALAATYTQ